MTSSCPLQVLCCLALIIATLMLANVPLAVASYLQLAYDQNGNVVAQGCGLYADTATALEYFLFNVWPWWDLFYFCLGPFAVLITCNVTIIVRLVLARSKVRSLGNMHSPIRNMYGHYHVYHLTWASYQIRKIVGCACARNAGNIFPATDFKGNR